MLLIGTILFFGLKLINLIFQKLHLPKRLKRHLDYSLALMELLIWLAFFSWVIMVAYRGNNKFILLFLVVAFILLIVPAFILIRDFIFGIFLKSQNKLPVDTIIEIDDSKGRITKAGHFFLNIEDEQGNIKSYNYYKLNAKVISTLGEHHKLEKLDLTFELPFTNNVNELTTKLKNQLLCTPWVAVSMPIKIEKIKRNGAHILVKIGLFTLDKKYEENIKLMVEKDYV